MTCVMRPGNEKEPPHNREGALGGISSLAATARKPPHQDVRPQPSSLTMAMLAPDATRLPIAADIPIAFHQIRSSDRIRCS